MLKEQIEFAKDVYGHSVDYTSDELLNGLACASPEQNKAVFDEIESLLSGVGSLRDIGGLRKVIAEALPELYEKKCCEVYERMQDNFSKEY